jgi:hypothetical protein
VEKMELRALWGVVVSFGFFFGFRGISNLKSLGFLTRNKTILSAKSWLKRGG